MKRLAILNNRLEVTEDPAATEPDWTAYAPLRGASLSPDALAEVLRLHLNRWHGGRLVNLTGADLSDANFSGADLRGAYFSDANFSGADLRGAYFSGAYFSGANLSGADLSDAYFSGADLSGANLSGADLSDAYFSGADLTGADLSRANLSGANLSGADLSDAYFSGADLTGADLSRANLSGATMPDGRPFAAYRADPLAGICDEPEVRARAEAAMRADGHTWQNCPMHAAFGIESFDQAPEDKRAAVAAFVALYDARLLEGAK